jgi:hypothetical protein
MRLMMSNYLNHDDDINMPYRVLWYQITIFPQSDTINIRGPTNISAGRMLLTG